jgi:hypothetical protein
MHGCRVGWWQASPTTHATATAWTNAAAGWVLPGKVEKGQNFDSGYRVTGAFLKWAEAEHPGLVLALDKALRARPPSTPALWQKHTGKALPALWAQYAKPRLDAPPPAPARRSKRRCWAINWVCGDRDCGDWVESTVSRLPVQLPEPRACAIVDQRSTLPRWRLRLSATARNRRTARTAAEVPPRHSIAHDTLTRGKLVGPRVGRPVRSFPRPGRVGVLGQRRCREMTGLRSVWQRWAALRHRDRHDRHRDRYRAGIATGFATARVDTAPSRHFRKADERQR